MRTSRTLLAATIAAAMATPGLTGIAHALVPPAGPRCSLAFGSDPTGEPGHQIGTIAAGPLVAAGTTMTVTCSVQVGGTGVHTDPDVVTVPAGPSANSVTLPPTSTLFSSSTSTYVCTAVHQVDSFGTYDLYWDETTQAWSQNASTSYCLFVPGPALPVNGGITVVTFGVAAPVVTTFGVLSDPLLWTCNIPPYTTAAPWTITCNPVSSIPPWSCAAVAASSMTYSPFGKVRTSLDCDGASPPEAQTATVSGTGGVDADWANTNVVATQFSCTFDNGSVSGPFPDFVASCGDPGA